MQEISDHMKVNWGRNMYSRRFNIATLLVPRCLLPQIYYLPFGKFYAKFNIQILRKTSTRRKNGIRYNG